MVTTAAFAAEMTPGAFAAEMTRGVYAAVITEAFAAAMSGAFAAVLTDGPHGQCARAALRLGALRPLVRVTDPVR